jgi:endonuclease III
MTTQERALKILEVLKQEFPNTDAPLTHSNVHELLFAVILSAQSTDVGVNKATPGLFARFPTIQSMAEADVQEVNELIKTINFHNNKALSLVKAAKMLMSEFGGQVPDKMEDLIRLPGVARKTANVVLYHWFKKNEGVVVDTHVKRVAYRLGLTKNTDPVKVEQDLMQLYPQDQWGEIAIRLIFHGRKTCDAKKPKCAICPLRELSPKVDVDPRIVALAEK